jgi:hypothetical protein
MPAKNKRQQRLFGMALALERGKMPKDKASKKVKAISKGMSEKAIEDFAKTRHKGLKESRALTFEQFINEAYIDQEGRLQDFDFTPDDRFERMAYNQLEELKDFLEDAGAERLNSEISGPHLNFRFSYRDDPHFMELNLETGRATLSRVYDNEKYVVFDGDGEELFDYIREMGLDI